jgi:hypothetical protein
MNEISCERIHIVPCSNPGLCCCLHRMVSTGHPADTVWRQEVWCRKWRENNDKSRVLNACDPDFTVKSQYSILIDEVDEE